MTATSLQAKGFVTRGGVQLVGALSRKTWHLRRIGGR